MSHVDSLLLNIRHTSSTIQDLLAECGTTFRVFDKQDSGCVSFGIRIPSGQCLFVKHAGTSGAVSYLKQVEHFHSEVTHPVIPKLLNSFSTLNGYAHVYEWVEGEVLGTPDFPGKEGRSNPESPHYRFRQQSVERIIQALNTVYELHMLLEEHGYVAVDFYDGCMIYDFQLHKLHLCDFDHYTKGAFILEKNRLFGSSRFMAPEEFIRGSRIDYRTNIYAMGAAAFVFLSDGSRELNAWRASEPLYHVVSKAAASLREDRYDSIKSFYEAWKQALASQQD
ncbi:serine/threonine-protein kinase [Paenibacillus sp. RC67]|uniref:serine/threonine-protein kinase n=1 Tax=Paenibacillus sp. RC67 TaxID=3039392 RepID=UPI0024AE3084|nr:serine/threonine-protein kinase [Paenibacillus sp. RC67]